ncbi:hypothetical protein TrVE_jg653 [Triparma verrucosa]|uniref:Uncharacterized protein n=1 Tax=Triparma verrucosa TaxID=1606542 RepID=A0A9W7FQ18_9STRA|nr:hypothetical protein TrVE_jg653 [Triparma verrucosa]
MSNDDHALIFIVIVNIVGHREVPVRFTIFIFIAIQTHSHFSQLRLLQQARLRQVLLLPRPSPLNLRREPQVSGRSPSSPSTPVPASRKPSEKVHDGADVGPAQYNIKSTFTVKRNNRKNVMVSTQSRFKEKDNQTPGTSDYYSEYATGVMIQPDVQYFDSGEARG